MTGKEVLKLLSKMHEADLELPLVYNDDAAYVYVDEVFTERVEMWNFEKRKFERILTLVVS